MNSPILLGQKLALRLVAGVDIPELRREKQTAVSLNAARVHGKMIRLGGTGPVIGNQDTRVVVFALARVELGGNCCSRCCGYDSSSLHGVRSLMTMEKKANRKNRENQKTFNIFVESY